MAKDYRVMDRWVNPFTRSAVRLGVGTSKLLLLTVTGRRSGRAFTFPVQYARDDGSLWVAVGDHEHKRWWRNLIGGAAVSVRVDGQDRAATATVVTSADEDELRRGVGVYTRAFPSFAKREEAPAEVVLVRIDES